ncbi:MAG: 5-(carboxyamino)imidazole ribonucleotide mutase [Candidatus Micrarchaeota archaeon]|nr:5-(carboxyamino)imidazole ribonucleotide mutase [Candidatus Micrarchaeota archaeon]
MPKVLILVGSQSDLEHANKCSEILTKYGVENKVEVASAHRDPKKVDELVTNSDADIFIAMAGLSAALPGVVASKTIKPVIGVPLNVKLDGLDALLSTMNIPAGVPVATVGIDNAKNAAFLALRILALKDSKLQKNLKPAMS